MATFGGDSDAFKESGVLETAMRSLLLLFLGVPIPIVILIALLDLARRSTTAAPDCSSAAW